MAVAQLASPSETHTRVAKVAIDPSEHTKIEALPPQVTCGQRTEGRRLRAAGRAAAGAAATVAGIAGTQLMATAGQTQSPCLASQECFTTPPARLTDVCNTRCNDVRADIVRLGALTAPIALHQDTILQSFTVSVAHQAEARLLSHFGLLWVAREAASTEKLRAAEAAARRRRPSSSSIGAA